jgi:hypothetical protein
MALIFGNQPSVFHVWYFTLSEYGFKPRTRSMLENGKYSVWFRTPLGEGTGIVQLRDGELTGGDTVLAYSGSYDQDGDVFSVNIATKRHSPGQLSVFGIDNVDMTLEGKTAGRVGSCRGKTRQAPGMTFEATIIRMTD